MAQRAVQPHDGAAEMVRCHVCRRDEPIVRCEDCGADLRNPHALVRVCDRCKGRRREARQSES